MIPAQFRCEITLRKRGGPECGWRGMKKPRTAFVRGFLGGLGQTIEIRSYAERER
jgi:hypothetical protein